MRADIAQHQRELEALRQQRASLSLAFGRASVEVEVLRTAMRQASPDTPPEQFHGLSAGLQASLQAVRDAEKLLADFDALGHIQLASTLLQTAQASLINAESHATANAEREAARAIVTAFLELCKQLEIHGKVFGGINGSQWWELANLTSLDYNELLPSGQLDGVSMPLRQRIRDIKQYLDRTK